MTAPSFAPDPRAILTAALADRYAIAREIGHGGMAIVFLADDVKHQRQVAIKVLRPELGAVLGVERFLSEIRVTASLQHPNLLPLFDSGEAGGLLYYVMPFVEGETLRARLDREQQLPIEEALRLARAMAGALDYAHQRGVIHRDLKPENVLLQAGQPVIADFGIALAVASAGGQRVTQTGLSLGTPQYMSPEQATGDRNVDARSDLYALGAIAYEMLAGEPPHIGASSQAVIARLLTEAPRPVRVVRPSAPEWLERVLMRLLEKLPADRYANAGELADALRRGAEGQRESGAVPVARTRRVAPWLVVATSVVVGMAGYALGEMRSVRTTSTLPVQRFEITLPDTILPNPGFGYAGAVSPDGRLVLIATTGFTSGQRAFLRRSDQIELEPFANGDEVQQPVFALDGESVFYLHGDSRSLRRYRVREHRSETIAPLALSSLGMDVTDDNRLVASEVDSTHRGLSVINLSGGDWKSLTKVDSASEQHVWPVVVPGERRVVFTIARGELARAELAIAELADGSITRLGVAGVRPVAVVEGYVVYLRADGALMAASLSARAGSIEASVPLGISASSVGPGGLTAVAVGRSGSLLHLVERIEFRGGELLPSGVSRPTGPFFDVRLGIWNPSPDGRLLAFTAAGSQYDGRVSLAELSSGKAIGKTQSLNVTGAIWDDDSRSLVLSQRAPGGKMLLLREVLGSLTPPETLGTVAAQEFALMGRFSNGDLLASKAALSTSTRDGDVYVLRKSGPREWKLVPYIATPAEEAVPALSPDGRWMAWQTNTSGYPTIAVRSVIDEGPTIAISRDTTIGLFPAWSADGRAIYLVEGTGRMHKVTLAFNGNRPQVVSDAIIPNLVAGTVEHPGPVDLLRGERFLPFRGHPDGRIFGVYARTSRGRYVYVPNWADELHAKLEAARRGK